MIQKVCNLTLRIPILGFFLKKLLPVFKPLRMFRDKVLAFLEKIRPFQVRQSYLLDIAYGNLRSRPNRTLITVFGMAAGVGIIVYLLSLGYGIERLVIGQVASLNELKIVDVSASQNTALKMNAQTIGSIEKIDNVDSVVPLISLVGRINFNKAQTDVLAYAADENFLNLIQLKLKKGKMLTDTGNTSGILNSMRRKSDSPGKVAGAQSDIQDATFNTFRDKNLVSFNILPQKAAIVWETCDFTSEMVGYTTRFDSSLYGKKMWGGSYSPFSPHGKTGYDKEQGRYLGDWLFTKVPIFIYDADERLIPLISDNGYQVWATGCIQDSNVQYDEESRVEIKSTSGNVLGTKTDLELGKVLGSSSDGSVESVLAASDSAELDLLAAQGATATGSAEPAFDTVVISTDSAGVEFVTFVASEEADIQKAAASRVKFDGKPIAQAMISTGLMQLLGIPEDKVISKTFTVNFIVSESLRPDVKGRQLSEDVEYEIVGLIDDDDKQYFYVPFSDVQKLGIQNFSQLKVVMKDDNGIAKVRTEIETFGFNTSSVTDTVAQIESLFNTLRIVLGIIGLIALAVASLGMFNTLTVSLLERTREIGGMKVIGMVSEEIQDLFLAEAMIMGFSGGIGGLLLGYLIGQISSILVSILSLSRGLGYLNLTYIPPAFIAAILILSFLVGLLTGLYPARRAKSISALNALRYE